MNMTKLKRKNTLSRSRVQDMSSRYSMRIINDPDDTFLINYRKILKTLEEENKTQKKDEIVIYDNRKDIILSRSFLQLLRKYLRIKRERIRRGIKKLEIE